jgi:hypothetical protein
MSSSSQREHAIQLPDGRQLVYAENGNPNSKIVVLFFSGYLSVGTVFNIPEPLRELDVHYIAPTLPGNAEASAIKDVPYNVGICQDATEILAKHHPLGTIEKLYIGGGSYGTVPAQMLYGAPYDLFPYGRNISGLLLLAGFSPFSLHNGYGKSMTWQNWISVGPFSQWFPWRIVPRLMKTVISSKMKDVASAKKFMHEFMISHMDDDEKKTLEGWLSKISLTEDQWIEKMAVGAVRCSQNWDGFLEGSDVLHSSFGFVPKELDKDHQHPVLIIGSDKDELGQEMNKWLKENYANSAIKTIHGGHIAATFHIDEIWKEMLTM